MITRQKLAAGLGGLTLMLGTLGGAAVVQPAQAETANGPDTDNVQDGTPDVPGAVAP